MCVCVCVCVCVWVRRSVGQQPGQCHTQHHVGGDKSERRGSITNERQWAALRLAVIHCLQDLVVGVIERLVEVVRTNVDQCCGRVLWGRVMGSCQSVWVYKWTDETQIFQQPPLTLKMRSCFPLKVPNILNTSWPGGNFSDALSSRILTSSFMTALSLGSMITCGK